MASTPHTSLLTLQQALQEHLLGHPSAIASLCSPSPAPTIEHRLAIYHHAYRARLHDTLADSYGHTLTYLGEAWFEREALAYIESHESRHFSLRWYGAGFPSWLAQRWPKDGEIAELAALDWALRSAFDAADAPVLGLADLARLSPEHWDGLQLHLAPGHFRLEFSYNTLALWHALDQDETPPAVQRLDDPVSVLVWRKGHSPHFRSLGDIEASALDGVARGLHFAALCDGLAQAWPDADAATEMGALLRRWLDEELLTSGKDPVARP